MSIKRQLGISQILILVIIGAVVLGGIYLITSTKKQPQTQRMTGRELIAKKQEEILNKKDIDIIYPKGISASAQGASRDPKIPSSVGDEFVYPGASVVTMEQMAGKGIVVITVSPDSFGQVSSKVANQVREAGWELIDGSSTHLTLKKGDQKAKVSLSSKDSSTVLTVAISF